MKKNSNPQTGEESQTYYNWVFSGSNKFWTFGNCLGTVLITTHARIIAQTLKFL